MLVRMITKKIGKRTEHFSAQGNNLFELCQEIEKIAFPDVVECGICKKDNLYLKSYLTKENFKYIKIVCMDCGASVTFGHPKSNPDVSYLRKTEDGKIDWKEKEARDEKQAVVKKTFEDDVF